MLIIKVSRIHSRSGPASDLIELIVLGFRPPGLGLAALCAVAQSSHFNSKSSSSSSSRSSCSSIRSTGVDE